MKVIYFGTSEFAILALKKLHESAGYDIIAVITQPDKPAGRKQELLPSPVKKLAQELGLKVLQPEKLTANSYKLKADINIVAAYGQIIPKEIVELPQYGALNIHPSLLSKYRGPSPIHTVILNGDKKTGVTIIKMDEQLDHGPILGVRSLELGVRTTYQKLHDELAELGADLLMEVLPKYISGEIKPKPQDHSKATYTKLISKDDARIDWSKPAEEIDRIVRAYHVWPVAWTTLDGKRLKIFNTRSYNPSQSALGGGGVPPLKVRGGEGELWIEIKNIFVHCGRGTLQILKLQLEGGKILSAEEFVRGFRNLDGKVLQ